MLLRGGVSVKVFFVTSSSMDIDISCPQQMHSCQYPTLARIAKDYLAIQGSSTASERAFSSGGITATPRRNSLHPETFGALQILKAGYRNGHLSAIDEAASTVPLEWVSENAKSM